MKKALNLFGITLLLVFLTSCPQPASNNGSPTITPDIPQDEITKLILTAHKDMFVDDTQQLSVKLRTTSGVDHDYTEKVEWILSEGGEEYLGIDKGFATATSVGAVSVTAKYGEALSIPFTITVNPEALPIPPDQIESLTLTATTEDMFVGDTQQLRVIVRTVSGNESNYNEKVKWMIVSEGGEAYLSIDEKGFATAKNVGAVTVRADYKEKSSNEVTITVNPKVPIISPEEIESLTLTATTEDMFVGDTQQLRVMARTNSGEEYLYTERVKWTFYEDGAEHLSIDEKGVATANSVATVSVAAEYEGGSSDFVTIEIVEPLLSHSMSVSANGDVILTLSTTDSRIVDYTATIKVGDLLLVADEQQSGRFTTKIPSGNTAGAVTYSAIATDKKGKKYPMPGLAIGPGGGLVFYMNGKGWELSHNMGMKNLTDAKSAVVAFNASETYNDWMLPTKTVLEGIYRSFYPTGLIPRDPTNLRDGLRSSTATSLTDAYVLDLTSPILSIVENNQSGEHGVRAVRALDTTLILADMINFTIEVPTGNTTSHGGQWNFPQIGKILVRGDVLEASRDDIDGGGGGDLVIYNVALTAEALEKSLTEQIKTSGLEKRLVATVTYLKHYGYSAANATVDVAEFQVRYIPINESVLPNSTTGTKIILRANDLITLWKNFQQ